MSIITILITVIVSGLIYIYTYYYGSDKLKYIFKPLTTICILLIAVFITTNDSISLFYKQMIVAGLFFSIWGDIFLMLPTDRFIPGLISFLIAHIFYIIAFSFNVPEHISFFYLIPFLLYAIIMFKYLSTGLGKLRIPVMCYITVIMVMVFLALNRFFIIPEQHSLYAFIGAIFFMISDTILAIKKFRFKTKVSEPILFLESTSEKETIKTKGEFKSAQLFIMTTYYTAQVFIAFSIQ